MPNCVSGNQSTRLVRLFEVFLNEKLGHTRWIKFPMSLSQLRILFVLFVLDLSDTRRWFPVSSLGSLSRDSRKHWWTFHPDLCHYFLLSSRMKLHSTFSLESFRSLPDRGSLSFERERNFFCVLSIFFDSWAGKNEENRFSPRFSLSSMFCNLRCSLARESSVMIAEMRLNFLVLCRQKSSLYGKLSQTERRFAPKFENFIQWSKVFRAAECAGKVIISIN